MTMSNTPNNADEGAERPASQERVTGAELTQAMARIEARRQAEAKRPAGTVPLGQAVEEMDLAVTPEELLAEVEALRRTARSPQSLPTASVMPVPIPQGQTSAVEDAAAPLTHCPACSRKLLTQASALCNWCGAKINDPQYQERAARSRQTLDRTELTQLETLVQEETRYGVFGRLKRRAKQNPGSRNTLG